MTGSGLNAISSGISPTVGVMKKVFMEKRGKEQHYGIVVIRTQIFNPPYFVDTDSWIASNLGHLCPVS